MNNRFKFRVWYKPYNGYVEIRDDLVLLPNGILCEYDGIEIDSDNYIIEMCTGLKDKNGNLIYEGDIVKIPDDYETYGFMSGEKREVYFRDGGFRLKPKDVKLGRGHWLEQTSALEIIGNIHKQPEQKVTQ